VVYKSWKYYRNTVRDQFLEYLRTEHSDLQIGEVTGDTILVTTEDGGEGTLYLYRLYRESTDIDLEDEGIRREYFSRFASLILDGQDRADLEAAVELLESPTFVAKLSDLIGEPIDKVVGRLPANTSKRVEEVVHSALVSLMNLAGRTLGDASPKPASTITHKLAATVSGAIGGAFGLAALSIELPITTAIILRSIADIARSEGEDLGAIETRLACIEVFALGGTTTSDDASETGYYAVRAGLSKLAPQAAEQLARRGVAQKGADFVARFIAKISPRFSAILGEKLAAQAAPILGAVGGATINYLFLDHFQNMARGHFIVRRLERNHGHEAVRQEYDRIAREIGLQK
jgi:hypothetical protein